MSLFSVLSVNGHTLGSFQKGIDLVNKNINNVDNPDYNRERAVFNELPTYGVTMAEAHRIYDQRYFDRFVKENQNHAYYQEFSSSIDTIESMFNDIHGSGFSKDINEYFHALNDIVAQPENIPARANFLEKAKILVSKMKMTYEGLQKEKSNLHLSIKQEIDQINTLSASLAKINKKIAGQPANLVTEQETKNTLLNQRDKIIKQLSSHIDVKVRYNQNGTTDIFSAKGHALVLFDKNFTLSQNLQTNTLDNELSVYSDRLMIDGVDLHEDFSKGTLSAKLHTQDLLDSTIDRVNRFAIYFADNNNQQHKQGYDLEGKQGKELFHSSDADPGHLNVSTLEVAIDDPKKIAASSQAGEISNNENAKKILGLQDTAIGSLDNKTFQNFYLETVSLISQKKGYMQALSEDSAKMVDALERKMQEISGVNLDEELMALTQLQRSYQASARVLNVTDKLLETVMNIIR